MYSGPRPHVQVTTTTTQTPAPTGYITGQGVILGQPPVHPNFPGSPLPPVNVSAQTVTPLPGGVHVQVHRSGTFLPSNPHQNLHRVHSGGIHKPPHKHKVTVTTQRITRPLLPGQAVHVQRQGATMQVVTGSTQQGQTIVQVVTNSTNSPRVTITKIPK